MAAGESYFLASGPQNDPSTRTQYLVHMGPLANTKEANSSKRNNSPKLFSNVF